VVDPARVPAVLALVARLTQRLETSREPVDHEPVIGAVAALIAHRAAVLGAVAVDVIDRQALGSAAARAPAAVVSENLLSLAMTVPPSLGAAQSPVPLGVAVAPSLPAFLAGRHTGQRS
jgi:hypothetical protein